MKLLGYQIDAADVALGVAGVLGVACFFLLLPGQHPHATAAYRLTNAEASARARALLAANGYATDALRSRTQFRANGDLLRALQTTLGRPQTVDTLRHAAATGEARRLPAYGWRSLWIDEDFGVAGSTESDLLQITLDEEGRLWRFERANRQPGLNREALATALDANEGTRADSLTLLSDSTLARHLRFEMARARASRAQRTDSAGEATPRELIAALQRAGRGAAYPSVPALGQRSARRLARYHLSRSALAGLGLHADSAWTVDGEPGRFARVRFSSTRPVWQQRVEATVGITAGGALRMLDPAFEAVGKAARDEAAGNAAARGAAARNAERSPGDSPFSITVEGVAEGVAWLALGALMLVVLVLFFRRLNARAIDAPAALRDALWGGLFAAVASALAVVGQGVLWVLPVLWGLVFLIGGAVTAGAGAGALVFAASSVADSLVREVWPRKGQSLGLVRRFSVRNVAVGAALLRGVALAGTLAGLATLVLLLFPQAVITLDESDAGFLYGNAALSFGWLFAYRGWAGLIYTLTVLGGWGALLQRGLHGTLAAAGIVGAFVLVLAGPYTLAPPAYGFGLAGTLGTALAVAFRRYDLLTCFTGYLLMHLLWGTAPGWLIAASPEWTAVLMTLGTLALTLALGLAGLRSGRTAAEADSYVPTYLQELAEQERLKRDIEIAEEVQRSFLPRRMPRAEGLDLAALCLPAREVGGDYYDFIKLPGGRLGVVIGDVSGKGIEASFYMTLAKGFLQTLAEEDRPPAAVLRRLNTLFRRNAPNGTFVTMIYGVADPTAGTFCFARAGHNPLAHYRAPGAAASPEDGGGAAPPSGSDRAGLVRPRGMAIGLADGAPFDDALEEVTLPLAPGDALVLYTDGLPEARGPDGGEFGEERVRMRIARHGGGPARQILQTLADDVHSFVEATGRHDDMTLLVLKRVAEKRVAERSGAPTDSS